MLLWSASDTNRHWFHKTNRNTKIFLTFLQMLTPEPVRLSCLLHSLTEVSWWRETELAYGSTRTVPPRPGCAVPKHSGLLSQWYQDKEAPHNAELHGWNTLKAELREQHPSQQHKKRLNYDMPHFYFFLPSKACWALVLFAWRVQTLNLCLWYTCCSRKQSQLDASLCNHTHSAVLATLGVYCSRPHRWWIMSERQVLLLTQALPLSPFAIVIIWINIPLQQVCTRTVYKKI